MLYHIWAGLGRYFPTSSILSPQKFSEWEFGKQRYIFWLDFLYQCIFIYISLLILLSISGWCYHINNSLLFTIAHILVWQCHKLVFSTGVLTEYRNINPFTGFSFSFQTVSFLWENTGFYTSHMRCVGLATRVRISNKVRRSWRPTLNGLHMLSSPRWLEPDRRGWVF